MAQSFAEAYFWFILASTQSNTKAVEMRDKTAKLLTPLQIADIQKRASEWKPIIAPVKQ